MVYEDKKDEYSLKDLNSHIVFGGLKFIKGSKDSINFMIKNKNGEIEEKKYDFRIKGEEYGCDDIVGYFMSSKIWNEFSVREEGVCIVSENGICRVVYKWNSNDVNMVDTLIYFKIPWYYTRNYIPTFSHILLRPNGGVTEIPI